ncbi:MAG: hypothetical protein QOF76_1804 [Solirubrobacteraceae bacterium]|jgi:hypothetical protein|nr:hypothetical protein [Solirubrobacteraceae bacterium]
MHFNPNFKQVKLVNGKLVITGVTNPKGKKGAGTVVGVSCLVYKDDQWAGGDYKAKPGQDWTFKIDAEGKIKSGKVWCVGVLMLEEGEPVMWRQQLTIVK